MSSQSSANFLEGHILRRFTVVKKVGSGAYGHVWKVEEKGTRRVFALKKIFDAFQHATDAQRTYREIEILRQLEHPNIIKLYDTIRADNNKDVYLLFEYMEADLHNVIAEGILKDVHIRFILYQMAKALKYLHSARLIHRDLKPSNILVNSNCAIKLCDFGLVRSLNCSQLGAVLTEGVATKPLFAGSCTMDQIEKICSFTGYPTEEDITSLESEMSRSLIKEMKVPNSSNPAAFLKDFSPLYADLLQRMLVFNPKKRITIDEILQHEIVKEFHKP
ncbi:uncharacterized protein LOC116245238 [Nymphaea colorata]|uniref:uncharacterized protein LOC116245238 n=1 Tax=Nymphaea colorata TaxID=210225 RepID=UPI00129EF4D3|nr:uncharacterized protein LOC116245238 [Nymphaea colorata]